MIFRVIAGTTSVVVGGFTLGAVVSSTYREKLDRNILRPIRNYR